MHNSHPPRVDFQHVRTNGIRLHVAQSAADVTEKRPLAILLHGFPEFWYGWRHQIGFLAANGFRVWAPDQRGYNLSDKPAGIGSYAIDELAKDVVGLIDAAGERTATLVGHDWGAAVAWWVALRYPERVDRLVILNVPHPAVMQRHVRRNFAQLKKSWYVFFFQLPWLPEKMASVANWRIVTQAMEQSSRRGTFTPADWDRYRQAWSQPKAYQSMIHWYRAAVRVPPRIPDRPRVKVPTLMIWGSQDKFLGREMAEPSIQLCEHGRLEFIEEATHWVQHEEPHRVNRLMLEHLEAPHPFARRTL